MGAYSTMDKAVAGLKDGLDSRVVSKRAADSAGIDFGMPVFGYVGDSGLGVARDNNIHTYKKDRGKIAFDADFITANSIIITVNTVAVTAVPFDTDHATTMANLIAQIETDIAGCDVTLDSTDADGRTIFIDIDGTEMTVAEAITGGGSQATGVITYSSRMIFDGFAMFAQKESAARSELDGSVIDAGDAKYVYKDAANVMINGWIYVVTADAVKKGNPVYVVAAAGATQGQCTDETSGNVVLTGAIFEETVAAAGIAKVRINK